ncbi:MAG: VWA domain-containing protein [Pseudomonadales bacterium]|nr:VWA domain-containing protein [Pseudomonadales bacterium]MCP5184818.1 VWA domain-containing protein [Pseudomonadales bacterium]
MSARQRRGVPEFSVSFLDVICCGFGAIILLLMITRVVQPVVLEQSAVDLEGQVAQREEAVHKIRGEVEDLKRQLQLSDATLEEKRRLLAELEASIRKIRGQYLATTEESEEERTERQKLVAVRQSLTEEMQRLLGAGFTPRNDLVGGVAVDSEYLIFVIDTSGSMQSMAWPVVVRKVQEALAVYPNLKGIQVMSDEGDYMFPGYAGQWIPDSPARRQSIINTLRGWAPFSDSNPVQGIQAAIDDFFASDKRISIYVMGDDFTGNTIEEIIDAVDVINAHEERGRKRVRINAVGFPVYVDRPNVRTYRFAALMRELAWRNEGTFVGLSELQ